MCLSVCVCVCVCVCICVYVCVYVCVCDYVDGRMRVVDGERSELLPEMYCKFDMLAVLIY